MEVFKQAVHEVFYEVVHEAAQGAFRQRPRHFSYELSGRLPAPWE